MRDVPSPLDERTTSAFKAGQRLPFAGADALVTAVSSGQNASTLECAVGEVLLPMSLRAEDLNHPALGSHSPVFTRRVPHLVVVDDFFTDPDAVRALALHQRFASNERSYKGKRTAQRFLWPHLREEFERLLGCRIIDWLDQAANGCFQITGFQDSLVWHSDHQSFAAAIYLTPDAPIGAGTSFWRHRGHGCRRPPDHELEVGRFSSQEQRDEAEREIYTQYNLVHPDEWELVDQVGAVYNRLVLWDGQLIHSASSYEGLDNAGADASRLVQLFFFNIA